MKSNGISADLWDAGWKAGDFKLPTARYVSTAFAKCEADNLWPRVWQMACREEEIPRVGDYTVYRIVDQEILLIRTDADTVKAYHNVCPHRATALAQGSGRFSTGEITCPFHGWRWNLNGDSTFVLDREEFKGGCLSDDDVKLRECQVAHWLGCVWINMDPDASSFDDYIAPVRSWVETLCVDKMQTYWHRVVPVKANWKITQEAFFEAYHVPATHPQLESSRGREVGGLLQKAYQYDCYGKGHFSYESTGIFKGQEGQVSARQIDGLIKLYVKLHEGYDSTVLASDVMAAKAIRNRNIPEGVGAYDAFLDSMYEMAADAGRPMPERTDVNLRKWGGAALIFPNYVIFPQFGNALIYRARPDGDDPDACIFDVWSVTTYPEAERPPSPKSIYVDDAIDPDQLPIIPRQDFGNIPRVQKGLHSRGLDATILSQRQETGILNMHEEMDRYLSD